MPADPGKILLRYWGYERFRPLQEEIIQDVMEGRDTLALLPTGGGKSLCYQVPALAMDGVALVVSPLIALMKDQVSSLERRGIRSAAIYSGMSWKDIDRILGNALHGDTKLLYVSPERLQTELAAVRISEMNLSFVAVDEAHCISQWGYDFRPAYKEIMRVREWHPDLPVLALTATATERVVDDIQASLNFRHKHVRRMSFARPNLAYIVQEESSKRARLSAILNKIAGSSVVYVDTRRMAAEVAKYLVRQGESAEYYHAGLDKTARSEIQDRWISSATRTIVATNAFGMGIDHPHVRSVIHLAPPASIEAYFQEAGRAGRDGDAAYAVMLYDKKDINALLERLEGEFPEPVFIRQVYQALGSHYQVAIGSLPGDSFDFDLAGFAGKYGLDIWKTIHALKLLEEAGYIFVSESVWQPSRLVFSLSRTELYEFLLKHPQQGDLLRTLLRIYQGIYDREASIDEYKIARHLKMTKEAVIDRLKQLHNLQLIRYTPTKESPQIGFPGPRVAQQNLELDIKALKQRKAWRVEMVGAMIRFLGSEDCRSIQLLAYFGERGGGNCGICDRCRAGKKRGGKVDKTVLQVTIRQHLVKGPLSLEALLERFPEEDRDMAAEVIQYMCGEEWIAGREGRLYLTDM